MEKLVLVPAWREYLWSHWQAHRLGHKRTQSPCACSSISTQVPNTILYRLPLITQSSWRGRGKELSLSPSRLFWHLEWNLGFFFLQGLKDPLLSILQRSHRPVSFGYSVGISCAGTLPRAARCMAKVPLRSSFLCQGSLLSHWCFLPHQDGRTTHGELTPSLPC